MRPRLPGGGDGVGGEQRGGTGSGPGIGTGIALARRLRLLGCMTQTPSPATQLPHHERIAHQLCLAFVTLVARTRVGNAQRRAQARKSAASAPLHGAEGAARQTRADRARAHAIALCECCVRVARRWRLRGHWALVRRPMLRRCSRLAGPLDRGTCAASSSDHADRVCGGERGVARQRNRRLPARARDAADIEHSGHCWHPRPCGACER